MELTYDAERFPGEAKSTLPSSIPAAAPGGPDPDDVLQPEDHDHHELLQETQTLLLLWSYTCFHTNITTTRCLRQDK